MDEQRGILERRAEEKERRINLINRRSVAWLFEVAVINVLVSPLVLAIYLHSSPDTVADLQQGRTGSLFPIEVAIWAVYLSIRDLVGSTSFGKYLVGLGLARSGSVGDRVPIGPRIIRNLPLIIPFVPVIEFFIAFFGNEEMQRLGDKMAGTQVIDLSPSKAKGSWSGLLVLAFLFFLFVNFAVLPRMVAWYSHLLG